MKHKKNNANHPSGAPMPVAVCFEFTHPTAQTVAVAGTFNDWNPTTKAMHSTGSGHWQKEAVLVPGTYEYCLVVDGQWMPDPQAKDCVPNPYGGHNSVLTVPASPEAMHLADATHLPLKNANQ